MLKGPPALVLQESEPVDLDAGGSQCGRRCLKKMRAKDDLKGLTDREESLDKKVDPVHTKPVQHISAASVNYASIQGELKTSRRKVLGERGGDSSWRRVHGGVLGGAWAWPP